MQTSDQTSPAKETEEGQTHAKQRCRQQMHMYGEASSVNVFALPHQILHQYKKNQRLGAHNHRKEILRRGESLAEKVELGEVGKQYEQNLRRTMLNQTKNIFNAKKRRSAQGEKNLQFTLELDNIKQKKTNLLIAALGGASDTLKILEKFILKEGGENRLQVKEDLQLESTRLPMIRKEWRRGRAMGNYDPKYKWSPSEGDPLKHTSRHRGKWLQRMQISGWQHDEHQQY